jgi:hypothetical protein
VLREYAYIEPLDVDVPPVVVSSSGAGDDFPSSDKGTTNWSALDRKRSSLFSGSQAKES